MLVELPEFMLNEEWCVWDKNKKEYVATEKAPVEIRKKIQEFNDSLPKDVLTSMGIATDKDFEEFMEYEYNRLHNEDAIQSQSNSKR